MSAHVGKRREDRCGVTVRAVVHGPGEQRFEGWLRNISPTGACVEHRGQLMPGDDIALEMENPIPQPARVIWASDRLAGISFAEQGNRLRPQVIPTTAERRTVRLVLASVALVALSFYGVQAWLIQ
jgi:hypothetical protein